MFAKHVVRDLAVHLAPVRCLRPVAEGSSFRGLALKFHEVFVSKRMRVLQKLIIIIIAVKRQIQIITKCVEIQSDLHIGMLVQEISHRFSFRLRKGVVTSVVISANVARRTLVILRELPIVITTEVYSHQVFTGTILVLFPSNVSVLTQVAELPSFLIEITYVNIPVIVDDRYHKDGGTLKQMHGGGVTL